MSQTIVSLIAAVVTFFLVHQYVYPAFNPKPAATLAGVSLEDTIRSLKRELAEIGGRPGETAGLHLGDVVIELSTQRDVKETGSAGIKVPVFTEAEIKAEVAMKQSAATKTTLTLQAPSGTVLLERDPEVLDLSEIVLSVRQALLATVAEKPELKPKSAEIKVSFVIVKTTGASAGLKAFVVNSLASSSDERTFGNTITLKFSDKPEQPK